MSRSRNKCANRVTFGRPILFTRCILRYDHTQCGRVDIRILHVINHYIQVGCGLRLHGLQGGINEIFIFLVIFNFLLYKRCHLKLRFKNNLLGSKVPLLNHQQIIPSTCLVSVGARLAQRSQMTSDLRLGLTRHELNSSMISQFQRHPIQRAPSFLPSSILYPTPLSSVQRFHVTD